MEKKFLVFGNKILFSILTLLSVFLLLTLDSSLGSAADSSLPIRKAAVAGGFYPGSKPELENFVDTMLRQTTPSVIKGNIRGIIVPHAGYIYSGPVAAYAYKALEGQDIKTVIILSNSHTDWFSGISIYKEGSFETPLGLVEIDKAFAEKIMAASPKVIIERPSAHMREHTLEVQLPFLQRVLKNFKIVPLVFGNDDSALTTLLADALKKNIDDKTLIVASTDMSHYPPYDAASTADHQTIQAIQTGKAENLDATLKKLGGERVPNAETFLCGVSGVRTLLLVSQTLGFSNVHFLNYSNSGDSFMGDKSRVVGYSSFAFTKSGESEADKPKPFSEENLLNNAEREELLAMARSTVESYVRTQKVPTLTPTSQTLQQKLGAFVTLNEYGQLRGCIGRFEPGIPLYEVISQMAIAAATQDPRFRPVNPDELGKLEYEISVLSPLRDIKSADEIVIGKHGVTVSKGFHHGVFLPQVATETGWSKEEFLSELCSQKAGLPRNCWKDPSVKLQVFTAEVFSEEKK